MKWQAVFWDFDGVVLDSVNVKTQAFALMFRKYGPEVEQAVVEYHLQHGGVSRFEKFRYYYDVLLKRSIDEGTLVKLGEEFSRLALQEVLAVPFIAGARETLELLAKAGIPSFVVSGTPEEEVQLIVRERSLSSYFLEVHGSPRQKKDILADIIRRKRYDPSNCLFLGDAMTDYEAALCNGTHFLGIVADNAFSIFPSDVNTSTCVTVDSLDGTA